MQNRTASGVVAIWVAFSDELDDFMNLLHRVHARLKVELSGLQVNLRRRYTCKTGQEGELRNKYEMKIEQL